jgi:CubicO group peptidase (beta-lactamase class C family)
VRYHSSQSVSFYSQLFSVRRIPRASKFSYTTYGYIVLGCAIECASGKA